MSTQSRSGLTLALASELVEVFDRSLPLTTRESVEMALLSSLAGSIHGCRNDAVSLLVRLGTEYGGSGQNSLPGRSEKVDCLNASVAMGTSALISGFGHAHFPTLLEPAAAVLGPVWTLGSERTATGEAFLNAFALGMEVQLRVGMAMAPWIESHAWDLTGACGVLGASVAAGLLVGLTPDQLAQAVGLAASQTVGQREAAGTPVQPFHGGKAASNGVLAALLVENGLTAPTDALENARGMFRAFSTPQVEREAILLHLGGQWLVEDLRPKVHPFSVLSQPAIEAALDLQIPERLISHVSAFVNPLVVELASRPEPTDSLSAQFSTEHAISVALISETSDRSPRSISCEDPQDPTVSRLRTRVDLRGEANIPRDQAVLSLTLQSGRTLEAATPEWVHVAPVGNGAVASETRHLVDYQLLGRSEEVVAAVDHLHRAETLAELIEACQPRAAE